MTEFIDNVAGDVNSATTVLREIKAEHNIPVSLKTLTRRVVDGTYPSQKIGTFYFVSKAEILELVLAEEDRRFAA